MLAKLSPGEELLALHVRAANLPAPTREHRFTEPRRWRFDFAWPAYKIAAEIEGGAGTGGRHTRVKGFEADCEKYNIATIEGWRVFRFTTGQVRKGIAIETIKKAIASAEIEQ